MSSFKGRVTTPQHTNGSHHSSSEDGELKEIYNKLTPRKRSADKTSHSEKPQNKFKDLEESDSDSETALDELPESDLNENESDISIEDMPNSNHETGNFETFCRSLRARPISPLTSPERSPPSKRSASSRVQNRRGPRRSEGRVRGRGGRVGQGRDSRISASGWKLGDEVVEVCVNDEDVPPLLQAETASSTQQCKRRRVAKEEFDSDEEYEDAESCIVNELFDGDRSALEFHWAPMATFNGHAEEFQPPNPAGPTENCTSAYVAFRKFWNDDILEHIVRETNRYASELKSSSKRIQRDWYDTNAHEVLLLFSFWIMLGIIKMPSIKSCYSQLEVLKTSVFKKIMTESRYWALNKALHFVDNSTRRPDSSKLFSLGPVPDHLNTKFKECYTPDQSIAIDESMTFWKGNLPFRQYITANRALIGIKTFDLCESMTGYLLAFIICTDGKDGDVIRRPRMPKSTKVVVDLVRPFLNRGHSLFMDHKFNSTLLARFLKRNKTDCTGILRQNARNVPASIQNANLRSGTCVARHSGDVVMMAIREKNPIHLITTCHRADSVLIPARSGKRAYYKLCAVLDYNKNKAGVDKKDQMLEPYLLERKKNRQWYKKLFKHLLDVSINNSRILINRNPQCTPVQHQSFRLELVDSILSNHLALAPIVGRRKIINNGDLPHERLVLGNHYPTHAGNKQSCLWCTVRKKKRSRTVYKCTLCNVPLCINCFEKFHTIP